MKIPYPVKTPALLKWFYSGLIWHQSRTEKVLYLTFDDGPIPEVTPFVLQMLAEFDAKATFFCIGDNVQKHPEVFKAIKTAGHTIGNHTFNHLKGWDTANAKYLENVAECNKLLQSNYFRPPYGRAKQSQLKALKQHYKIVMWDVLSGDFDLTISPQKCYQNVAGKSSNGSIIVFHDSLKAWPRLQFALPEILKHFSTLGFSFSALKL